MIFNWLARRRRPSVRKAASDEDWSEAFETGLWQAAYLSQDERQRLQGTAGVLVAEKNWEGLDDVTMTPLIKRTVALQIALMTLGFEDQYFENTPSILLEDGVYEATNRSPAGGTVIQRREQRLGEAWYRGPVKLSWPEVQQAGQDPNAGRHLTVHEFAHQLDTANGVGADGNPVIESATEAERWVSVCDDAYERLQRDCENTSRLGRRPSLDCYGATNRGEFFAVASEAFFQTPRELQKREPDVFEVLKTYYRQDPLRWDRG